MEPISKHCVRDGGIKKSSDLDIVGAGFHHPDARSARDLRISSGTTKIGLLKLIKSFNLPQSFQLVKASCERQKLKG